MTVLLAGGLLGERALAASPPPASSTVLVLQLSGNGAWPAGTQALVAELLTAGHELTVRLGSAPTADEAEQELRRALTLTEVSAGVAVLRAEGSAVAVLCRSEASCERLEVKLADPELSRSRLALAVSERLRPLDIPPITSASPSPPRAPVSVAPVAKALPQPAPSEAPSPRAPTLRLWLGGGAGLAFAGVSSLGWASASFGVVPVERWGLELGVGGSVLPGVADTYAGRVELRAIQVTALGTFEVPVGPSTGFSLGLGGGIFRVSESSSPASGFVGVAQSTHVGLVSAQVRLYQRLGPFWLGLSVAPGLLLPVVRVQAGQASLLEVGRPWLPIQASIGASL